MRLTKNGGGVEWGSFKLKVIRLITLAEGGRKDENIVIEDCKMRGN